MDRLRNTVKNKPKIALPTFPPPAPGESPPPPPFYLEKRKRPSLPCEQETICLYI